MYPLAIIALSMVTLFVLMTVALPPLLKVFDNMGAEIPAMTRFIVTAMAALKANFFTLIIGTILVWPMIIAVGIWGGIAKAKVAQLQTGAPMSGAAPAMVGRADGRVLMIPRQQLAPRLRSQNALRARLGLPPLPDPATVTHETPAVVEDPPPVTDR